MKPKIAVLLLCGLLAPAMQARAKTILPDACGDDGVKFDVTTQKDQPPPSAPAEGKAQIVFISTIPRCIGNCDVSRIGMDGAWVGANKENSYFALTVEPGEHHLCVSVQSPGQLGKIGIGVATIKAEPGKVYFFEDALGSSGGGGYVPPTAGPNGLSGGGQVMGGGKLYFNLTQLDDDMGKYRVKAYKLATWKTK